MPPERPVPPHATLRQYYPEDGARAAYVRQLFDDAAPHYEWINRLMSLGAGVAYRRRALVGAGLEPGMRVLDIATGTGLVLRPAAEIVGSTGLAIGLDPSTGMLRQARSGCPLPLVQAGGEALPFRGSAFDFISLGYGLRHLADLEVFFRECFRVLHSGGRLLVLEFARPRRGMARTFNRIFLKTLVPLMTRISTRHQAAETVMRYCWDSVDQVVPVEVVLACMRRAGLESVAARRVLGTFIEYSARRPETPPSLAFDHVRSNAP